MWQMPLVYKFTFANIIHPMKNAVERARSLATSHEKDTNEHGKNWDQEQKASTKKKKRNTLKKIMHKCPLNREMKRERYA